MISHFWVMLKILLNVYLLREVGYSIQSVQYKLRLNLSFTSRFTLFKQNKNKQKKNLGNTVKEISEKKNKKVNHYNWKLKAVSFNSFQNIPSKETSYKHNFLYHKKYLKIVIKIASFNN